MNLINIKFEINIFSLVAFLCGIFVGFLLFGLIYLFSCLISLRKTSKKINIEKQNISEQTIKDIIARYQEEFEDEKKRRKAIPYDFFKTALWNMMNDIAKQFYPDSKRPLLELTISECVLLDRYIMNKIEEVFSHRMLRIFKSFKISTIMGIVDIKTSVDNNTAVRIAKRYKLNKITNAILTAVNIINPYYLFKKIIINPTINMITNKICLYCFTIVGEETYKVYSKQALMEVDDSMKKLLDALEKEHPEEILKIENAQSED